MNTSKITDCVPCTPGKYCGSPGLTAPTGDCTEGYYCGGGSTVATPLKSGSKASTYLVSYNGDEYLAVRSNGTVNDICPPGHYCPKGSNAPIQCPPGTNSSSIGLTNSSSCPPCLKGYYCPHNGTVVATWKCLAGYYCPTGTSNPTLGCTVGHYCPLGSYIPLPCKSGTYMNHTGAAACYACAEGFYCNASYATDRYQSCPQGYACPTGTGVNWQSCAVGKYGSRIGLRDTQQCESCISGSYCSRTGLTKPNGFCSPGYYCPPGSKDSYGRTDNANYTKLCPTGSYCPNGTAVPHHCHPGTFNPFQGQEVCKNCTAGQYCELYNLTRVTGPCDPGYYCVGGSAVRNPSHLSNGGTVCPIGHYCPVGTSLPYPCSNGTYQSLTGQSSCISCPSGYYCTQGTSNFATRDCPVGHYCPTGTKYPFQYPCPSGTYNNLTNRHGLSDCLHAPPGYYVSTAGSTQPYAQCSVGYYCPEAATTSTPACNSAYCSKGGACKAGEICPLGSGSPLPCPGGRYCNNTSGVITGVCTAGYYCIKVILYAASYSDSLSISILIYFNYVYDLFCRVQIQRRPSF